MKKHAAKKHPAKKEPAKAPGKKAAKDAARKAAKHAASSGAELAPLKGSHADELGRAFHHLQRAAAVISLLEGDSGEDLRRLFDHGVRVYRMAAEEGAKKRAAAAARGLLRASEHLALMGLYLARAERIEALRAPADDEMDKRAKNLRKRSSKLQPARGEHTRWLLTLADGLAVKADEMPDAHVRWEVVMAVDGVLEALEADN